MLSHIPRQRINIDILNGPTVRGVRPIHATAAGGLPDMNPVGSPIAGPAKTDRIHQGFQQQRTMTIAALPVAWHLPGAQRQDLARQTLDLHPRQDEESSVVHDPLEVLPPLPVAPS